MSTLTDRQRKDLYNAIYEFLLSEGDKFTKTLSAFKTEAEIKTEEVETGKGLLERKWTGVVRLQKRVMELESQIVSLQSNKSGGGNGSVFSLSGGSSSSSSSSSLSGEPSRCLPRGPLRSNMMGHRGPVTCVATHPIYSLVASSSEDATIKIWDYESAQYERTLKGHTGVVTGLCFDPSGNILASCSADISAKLWDMSTYTCTKTLKGHDHTISAVQFLPSGDFVLTCSRDNTVKCWEVATGFCTRTFSGHSDWVKTLSISLDGELLASGGSDQNIIVWKVSNGQQVHTLRGHEHVIETLSFGKKPITLSVTAAVLQSTSSSSSSSSTSTTAPDAADALIESVASSADTFSYLASGSRDKTIRLWDPLKAQLLMTFSAHENWVRSVLIHPSGKYIISCSDDKSIRIMDIKEKRCMRTIPDAHAHFVTSLALSAKHPILISGSVDKNVNVWGCF